MMWKKLCITAFAVLCAAIAALRLCRRCARRIFLKLWRFLGFLIFGGCWRIARFSLRQLFGWR